MKKRYLILLNLVGRCCAAGLILSLPARAGTNAPVTVNTNTGQLSNLGYSTGGQGLFWSNTITGAWGQIPTNSHIHVTDEYGTTYDFHTNGTLAILKTNGVGMVVSNGSLTLSSNLTASNTITAANFVGSGAALTGVNGFSGDPSNFTTNGSNQVAMANVLSAIADSTVVVCPFTNLPASITNSTRFFGPWRGANYVQQAINALPRPVNVTSFVGGGKIIFAGTNFYYGPLIFSNGGAPMSWDLEASSFCAGALVCMNNCTNGACIQFICPSSQNNIEVHNLLIASATNATNILLEISNTFSRVDVSMNYFGYWPNMQSNSISVNGAQTNIGLVTPTGGDYYTNSTEYDWPVPNLVGLYIEGEASDMATVTRNSFSGLATGLVWGADHGRVSDNMFSMGGTNNFGNTNQWPRTSLFCLGPDIILQQLPNGDGNHTWTFVDNHFYGPAWSYLVDSNYDANAILDKDSYEISQGMLVLPQGSITVRNPGNFQDVDQDPSETPWVVSVTGPPYTIGGFAPTGQVRFESFDSFGFIVQGPGNCSFQSGPTTNGGSYWNDQSGHGMAWDGSGNALIYGTVTPGGGIATTNTASPGLTLNGTGVTNTLSRNVVIPNFGGTSVLLSNTVTHAYVTLGSPITSQYMILHPNECLRGTSCSGTVTNF